MIVANINSKELSAYATLHPAFAKAFDEMKRILAEGAEDGKIVLDGDKLFINVQSYTSKPESDCGFEAHKKYIDIQFVFVGSEQMEYADLQTLTVTQPYSEDGDCALESGNGVLLTVNTGDFVVFCPEDAHKPGCGNGSSRKVIVKVPVK